jgi:hypothetical protein
MTEIEKQTKIDQVKDLLLKNREDAARASGYVEAFKCKTIMELRVEKELLEHQLLVLTGFQEAEVEKIIGDLKLVSSSKSKDKGDDNEGKEPVAV